MAKTKTDDYGGVLLKELRQVRRRILADTVGPGPLSVIDRTIRFLDRRLTDAAKAGCHHCDDVQEKGGPCWWCGLKVRGR